MVNRVRKNTKRLGYRDQTGRDLEFHTAAWEGFTFWGGPWIVSFKGAHGDLQVWARDEAEGKRVIRHAAAAGGIDVDDPNAGEWIVVRDSSGRSNTVRQYGTKKLKYGISVSKRPSPAGFPEYVDLTPPQEGMRPRGEDTESPP